MPVPSAARPNQLKGAARSHRARALFRAMADDVLLREQFVTDPAQVYCEYVHRSPLAEEKASVVNQLVYAVAANRGLVDWLQGYTQRRRRARPSTNQFVADFARAVVETGSREVVVGLVRSTVELDGSLTVDDTLLDSIFDAFDDDPGTGGGEGTSPGTGTGGDGGTSGGGTGGDGGTGGGGTGGDGGTSPDPDPGTGGGEGTSPGTVPGTEDDDRGSLDLGSVLTRVTLQALVSYAQRLGRMGALDQAFVEAGVR